MYNKKKNDIINIEKVVIELKINSKKVEMMLADRCMLYSDLAKKSNLSSFTITRMRTGAEVNPSTVGKIAKALGVTVQELIETEAATSNLASKGSEGN